MSDLNHQSNQNIGRWMTYLAWVLFLGLLTLAFKKYLDQQNNPNQDIALRYNSDQVAEVTLIQNRQGHYLATGKINDQPVTFLLDTGATHISIPEHIAQSLKLRKGFPAQSRTANGTITVYDTRLKSVSLGAIKLHNIRASINPHMPDDEILLGMSFMKHLELIQKDRQLILRNPI